MHRMKMAIAATFLIAGTTSLAPLSDAVAHGDGLDAHGARHAAMKAIGSHMKALSAVAKGQAPADEAAAAHAKSLRGLAGTTKFLFPQEAQDPHSRAIPAIWERWDEFVAVSDEFTTKTIALQKAVASGDAGQIGAALGEVGKTCGGCHKPFRGPKK